MTDQPLFQNADEQEETYAPQQLPQNEDSAQAVPVVPLTGGAFQAGEVAPGTATQTGPVVGAAALAAESERDDEENRRSS